MKPSLTLHAAIIVGALVWVAPIVQGARLGHPGQSASAATSAQRQWNLLCDPQYASSGWTSTHYDPSVAQFFEVNTAPGFYLVDLQIELMNPTTGTPFIDEYKANGATGGYQPGRDANGFLLNQFGLEAPETGYLRAAWSDTPPTQPGMFPPHNPADAVPSTTGDEITHFLVFNDISKAADATTTFTNYSDQGPNGIDPSKMHFATADFYTGMGPDGVAFTYSSDPTSPNYVPGGIPEASATFAAGTPEPSAVALIAVAGIMTIRRSRTGRSA